MAIPVWEDTNSNKRQRIEDKIERDTTKFGLLSPVKLPTRMLLTDIAKLIRKQDPKKSKIEPGVMNHLKSELRNAQRSGLRHMQLSPILAMALLDGARATMVQTKTKGD